MHFLKAYLNLKKYLIIFILSWIYLLLIIIYKKFKGKEPLYHPLNPEYIPISEEELKKVITLQKFFKRFNMRKVIEDMKVFFTIH